MRSGSPWILSQSAAFDAKSQLFCLPLAGRGASMYASWTASLGPEVEVVPIQLPGRENRLREPAIDRLDVLAREIVSAIRDRLERPFALFGHSMGALVAFEVARELRRQGLPSPRRLFASSKRAPQLGPDPVPMGRLPDAALLGRLHEEFGLDISDEMKPLIELMLPTIRADICAVDDYCYAAEEPFRFPIVALGGDDDASVSVAELQAWGAQTTSTFALRLFPGGHFFLDGSRRPLTAWLRQEMTELR
jgi:surfactin synthase thioesterase subunit